MTTQINQLIKAYSVENLTRISAQLINAYKDKNHTLIYAIANACNLSEDISPNRLFSKIIQLYHPDKAQIFFNQLIRLNEHVDESNLDLFTHIFKTERLLEKGIETPNIDIEFDNEGVWEESANNDYQYYNDENMEDEDDESYSQENDFYKEEESDNSYNFYEAIQLREYGDLSKTFPSYYLEDIDEFELASSQIDSLEGAEFCKHAKVMDLSDNAISDLSELFELLELEELYLAHNELSYIDTLSNLTKLKTLDLSFNQIDDISPLFSLENLEYVNLVGNPVSKTEIEFLKLKVDQVIY